VRAPLGELLRAAYLSEFTRLRDGDQFFYQGSAANFSAAEQAGLSAFKMADLVLLTTNISRLQCSAFYAFSSLLDCELANPGSTVPEQTLELLGGRVEVRWNISGDVISLQVRANTTGWVAIGMPP
jgi:hypothetical protein